MTQGDDAGWPAVETWTPKEAELVGLGPQLYAEQARQPVQETAGDCR